MKTREERIRAARERVVKAAKRLCRMGPEHSGFLTMYYELDNAVAWLNKLEARK